MLFLLNEIQQAGNTRNEGHLPSPSKESTLMEERISFVQTLRDGFLQLDMIQWSNIPLLDFCIVCIGVWYARPGFAEGLYCNKRASFLKSGNVKMPEILV